MIEEVRKKMDILKEDKVKEFNKKICSDTKKEMLGIRIPVLRNLAKQILKNYSHEDIFGNKGLLYKFNENSYEEVILQGFIIAYANLSFELKKPYIENYIPKMDSWSITDVFVPTLKIKEKELREYWFFILKYIKSEEEFEIRFAIISMLKYFIIDEYIDEVINLLNNINHDGYYVKMGIAWTLAEAAIKYNEKVIHYLEKNNNLDKFTYNKTLQKMIESYRFSNAQKEIYRKMKIK